MPILDISISSEGCSGSMLCQPSLQLPFEIDAALGGAAAVTISQQVTFLSRRRDP